MKRLTHTDAGGKAKMVDVGDKVPQLRIASARGHIRLAEETIELVRQNQVKKGDVLTLAQVAGIQAAKRTPELVPLCHNIFLEKVDLTLKVDDTGVYVESEARSTGKTGVEMEALTAVSVALLTIYDMCKAVDKGMVIDNIELIEKIKK